MFYLIDDEHDDDDDNKRHLINLTKTYMKYIIDNIDKVSIDIQQRQQEDDNKLIKSLQFKSKCCCVKIDLFVMFKEEPFTHLIRYTN